MTVVVNGAFRPQEITGQQRYATEIADRLLRRGGFVERRPTGLWTGSAPREWLWALLRLPRLLRGRRVLSLTSRGPVIRNQVLVVHDVFVLTDPQWFSRRYVLTHAPVLRAQLRRARAVVAVSPPVAEQVSAFFTGPVAVAPNAPSALFSRAPSDADHALGDLGLTSDGYLLTVGSLDPRKNLRRLAAAWRRIPEAEREATPLVVVGSKPKSFRDVDIHWPTGTRVLGYVPDDDLRQLYAGARAVVFPTLAEGFGLPLVEAVAAGVPRLVVSDIPVFHWICGDGASYVRPTSVEDLARGLADALARRGPGAGVREGFDWDRSAEIVADLCRVASPRT